MKLVKIIKKADEISDAEAKEFFKWGEQMRQKAKAASKCIALSHRAWPSLTLVMRVEFPGQPLNRVEFDALNLEKIKPFMNSVASECRKKFPEVLIDWD